MAKKTYSNPNSPQNYGPAMMKAMKNTKVFGMPAQPMKKMKKMPPEMVAKRKRSMISNAASKVMGGKYSK